MADIRTGSTVDLTLKEASGPGSNDVTFLAVTVADISDWGITYDDGNNKWGIPWLSVRRVKLITH